MSEDDAIHEFRYGGQGALTLAALSGALVLLTILAAAIGPGFDATSLDPLWLVLAVLFLAALSVLPLWLRARAPVLMRIGPEGLSLPLTWSAPLPWQDIHRIILMHDKRFLSRTDLLRIDLLQGRLPPYRFVTHKGAEKWLLRKVGLRIPISSLSARPEVIVASVERFRPVVEDRG